MHMPVHFAALGQKWGGLALGRDHGKKLVTALALTEAVTRLSDRINPMNDEV
jgi:hypothetical protein